MNNNATQEPKKQQMYTMYFNIAVMISSFVIALIALPYEMFFIVAVIILFALRDVEKDLEKFKTKRSSVLSNNK